MFSFLIVGIVAGWLAGQFMQGSGYGLIGDLVLGVVGSFIGGFLFTFAGVNIEGMLTKIIMATIGAVALLYVIRVL